MTTEHELSFSPQLLRLCRLIDSAVGGTPIPQPTIGDDLAFLAQNRHRVGPLLHHVATTHEAAISPSALEGLQRDRRDNERRQALAELLLRAVARWFSSNGIRWTLMKGLGLARQLYSNPALRPSADIDLLVSPDDFRSAIRILESHGFRNLAGSPATRILKAAAAYLFRDVALLGAFGPLIELHQRPLFVDGRRSRIAPLVAAAGGEFPVPAVDSNLAQYLLGHGALCYWSRLKWLVDLVPLFAILDDAAKRELLSKSRRSGTTSSLCASLLLLRALFPGAALGPLGSWTESEARNPKVIRRLAHYVRAIDTPVLCGQTPLDNRVAALKANLLFSEAVLPRLRILTIGPACSLLRAMGQASAILRSS
jgi:hypothetical protein